MHNQVNSYSSNLQSCNSTSWEHHIGIILTLAGSFSRPLKAFLIDAAVLDATLPCGPLRSFGKLTTLLLMLFSFPHNNWRVSLSSPTASWMLESLCTWCFSWTEKIDFFINSRQRTSRFSVRLSDYFPNPAPQNRRFPCPVHNSNPESRSFFTLNSRIPAFS